MGKQLVYEEELKQLASEGKTVLEISNLLGCTRGAVYMACKKYDITYSKAPKPNRKYLNKDITKLAKPVCVEAAYYIGLLFADGWIGSKHRDVGISLQERDSRVLYSLAKFVGVPKEAVRTGKLYGITKRPKKLLYISSKELVTALADFAIVPNKTKQPHIPVFSDDTLQLACLKGWFDGDGYIGRQAVLANSNPHQAQSFCNEVKRLGGNCFPTTNARGTYVRLNKGSNRRFIHNMFTSTSIGIARKYEAFTKSWKLPNEKD